MYYNIAEFKNREIKSALQRTVDKMKRKTSKR